MDFNKLITECQYVICKECHVELKRFRGGMYPNGKDTKYTDETGREWSGRKCPACHNKANIDRQKTKRRGTVNGETHTE